jgi:hypothetical protein
LETASGIGASEGASTAMAMAIAATMSPMPRMSRDTPEAAGAPWLPLRVPVPDRDEELLVRLDVPLFATML